jgi:hypothetical protein
MSDYLWDKTGEPEAEVERLEALLAGFRHAPRPLPLPAEAVAFTERRPSRLFKPAWLAAAAALLLASLVGVAAFMRARVATEGKAAVASETLRPRERTRAGVAEKDREEKAAVAEPARVKAGASKDERAAVGDVKRVSHGRKGAQLASLPRRRWGLATPARDVAPAVGSAFESMSAGGVAPTLIEGTRLMAKEQLVYALRLTGAKLRDVRLKTQGLDGKEAKQP